MKLSQTIEIGAAAAIAAGVVAVTLLLSAIGPLPDGREASRADLALIATIPVAVVVDAKLLPLGTAGTTMAPMPNLTLLPPLPLALPPRSPHYWTMDEAGSAAP